MEMPADDEIHAAPLGNRHEIAVVEYVRVGMMRDEDAPVRSFRLRAQKVLFDPGERLAHLPPRLLIGFRRRIDGVHLEETPGIAVHHREMDTANVERIREAPIRIYSKFVLFCGLAIRQVRLHHQNPEYL